MKRFKTSLFVFFKTLFIFIERGREREGEGEKHRCVRDTFIGCPTGDLAHNPGVCPDWDVNR